MFMKHNVLIFNLAIATLLLTGCSNCREEVVQTFADGSATLVYLLQGDDDNPLLVGEKSYYDNGNLRWEKHYADGKPSGTWSYYYPSGKPFCTVEADKNGMLRGGKECRFWSADGKELAPAKRDSVRVEWLGSGDAPSSPSGVSYYYGTESEVYLFYEDYSIRYHGFTLNNQPNGHCTFYYPNGQPQTEAIYADGLLNGLYTVYRDSGVPYYRGAYIGGKRAGTWEFLEEDGSVAYTKEFD